MYKDMFKLALDIVNDHGDYDDFVAAIPFTWEKGTISIKTRRLIFEMAEYVVNEWLKE